MLADGAAEPEQQATRPLYYFIQVPSSPVYTHPATVGSNVGSPVRAEGAHMPMFLQSPATITADPRTRTIQPAATAGGSCRVGRSSSHSSPELRHRDAVRATTRSSSNASAPPRMSTKNESHLVKTVYLNAATSPGAAVAPIRDSGRIRTCSSKTGAWAGETQEHRPESYSPRRAFKTPPMTTGLFAMEPSDCSSPGRRSGNASCARRCSLGSRKSPTSGGEAQLDVLILADGSSPRADMSRSGEVGEVFLPAIALNKRRQSLDASGCGSTVNNKLPDIVSSGESLHYSKSAITSPTTSRRSIGEEVAQYATSRRDALQETFKASEICPMWVAKHAFEYAISNPNTFRV